MKLSRNSLAAAISFSLFLLSFLAFPAYRVSAQDIKIALQRGYRTGYSDGYMSGYRDSIENATKNYQRHNEYVKADRAYNKDYGTTDDYRDGYRQGFEIGYNTGFDKKSFDAVLPADLKKRGLEPIKTTVETTTATVTTPTATITTPTATTTTTTTTTTPNASNTTATTTPIATETVTETTETTQPTITTRTENVSYVPNGDQIIVIPAETELVVELLSDINTKDNKEGDKFQMRVVSPSEIGGAIIEGRVGKIEKPGRIKRRSSMALNFDAIRLNEVRWANYNAILTEVMPVKNDNIKRVDTEGTVRGKSSVKSDIIKIGAATGTGLVIGAIAGGPVGAGVGAGVGAAFGVGAVVIERGKNISLVKGQQVKIRTVRDTQIR